MKKTLIYSIKNLITDKEYIGVTTKTVEARLLEHIAACKRGVPFLLYHSMRKHGPESFTITRLETCDSVDVAKERERQLIAERGTMVNGYNMTAGGDGFRCLVRTREHSAAISASLMGHAVPDEVRRRLAEYRGPKASFYGKKHSPEWREKILAVNVKQYTVTGPDNVEIQIVNLKKFARENGLDPESMRQIATGKRKTSHKGYFVREGHDAKVA